MKINARVTEVSRHEGGGILVHLFFYNDGVVRPETLRVWWEGEDPAPAPGDFLALTIAPNPEP